MKNYTELTAEQVSFSISNSEIERLRDVRNAPDIIGQDRAIQALELGTSIRSKGYNIFISGPSGTGRETAVRKILKEQTKHMPELKDLIYVYNFKNPESPMYLFFTQGQAQEFKEQLHQLVENMKAITKAKLESDKYKGNKVAMFKELETRENKILSEFEKKISLDGFKIMTVEDDESSSTDILPVFDNEPIEFEDLQKLVLEGNFPEETWHELRKKYFDHIDEMKHIFQNLHLARNAMESDLRSLQVEIIKPEITTEVNTLRENFLDNKKLLTYLDLLEDDITQNLFLFTSNNEYKDETGNPVLIRYGVNILIDHSETSEAPVIFENHPTYKNLFGAIEAKFEIGGETRTSFMLIRAGSLLKASGGFIIIRAEDIFQDAESWMQLKRAIQSGKVEIQNTQNIFSMPGPVIKPEPVVIDTKIIILGSENLYDLIFSADMNFQKHFKVSAEFDSVMLRDEDSTAHYIDFIDRLIINDQLLPISNSGVAGIIKYGVWLAEDQNKLSTKFGKVADLLVESNYWAVKMGKSQIDDGAVERSLEARKYFYNLPEQKVQEMIAQGDIMINVCGSAVGKVNGLAVYDRGYYSFGLPALISCQIAPGNEGIINVEHEVGLSGEIHDKGILIIEGFLRSRFANDFPMSLFASICFEQSYSEVDGDSASSTEIYALLSAISNIPLRQDIAVTGSVNQNGQIQAVGGISEKIEGFYHLCKAMGLSGSHGVIIPYQNAKNLVFAQEICDAVADKSFHIYPIHTIDQGMEILTGVDAGIRLKSGKFTKDSINYRVEHRLREIANQVKAYNT